MELTAKEESLDNLRNNLTGVAVFLVVSCICFLSIFTLTIMKITDLTGLVVLIPYIVVFLLGVITALEVRSLSRQRHNLEVTLVDYVAREELFRQGTDILAERARCILAKAAEDNDKVNVYKDGSISSVVGRLEVSVEYSTPLTKAWRSINITLPDKSFPEGKHTIGIFTLNLESQSNLAVQDCSGSRWTGNLETFDENLELMRQFIRKFRFFNA